MALGKVMFLAAVAWVKGGEGGGGEKIWISLGMRVPR